MAPGYICIQHGLTGPNHAVVSACASGTDAIGDAYRLIKYGDVTAMLAGGADAIIPLSVASFSAARALATCSDAPQKASRPFDKNRSGFVMSEGAAMLVLEEAEFAKKRGAAILGEIVGFGTFSDAYHVTAPDPNGRGAVRAMRAAIAQAGIEPHAVGYVNAHATSTPLGDRTECAALKTVFGTDMAHVPVSSTKSATGHMLGAAGAIGAVFCLLAMRDGVIPPTINYETLDPVCDLDVVPNVAREHPACYALSNSFGFGGHSASLLMRRAD